MSATATMTMAQPTTLPLHVSATAPLLSASPPHCCPRCGFDAAVATTPTATPASPALDAAQAALLDARKQIDDLEAQVTLLNQKAVAAVERWAEYDDELARLRRQARGAQTPPPPPPPPSHAAIASPTRSSFLSTTTRLSSLLSPRAAKSTPNLKQQQPRPAPPTPPVPTTPSTPADPGTADLRTALTREQALRREAEGRLNATSREVEELSATLFEQANEMVATERRARAQLEARVEVLERRDVDKRHRLERLEAAMARIERVRAMLGGEGGAGRAGGGGGGEGVGVVSSPTMTVSSAGSGGVSEGGGVSGPATPL